MEQYALEQINRERVAVRNDIMEKTDEMTKEIGSVVGKYRAVRRFRKRPK